MHPALEGVLGQSQLEALGTKLAAFHAAVLSGKRARVDALH